MIQTQVMLKDDEKVSDVYPIVRRSRNRTFHLQTYPQLVQQGAKISPKKTVQASEWHKKK